MNKAFVKESDEDQDEDFSPAEIIVGHKNYMTPMCHQRLLGELNILLQNERPKLLETIAWAAGNGDRSENADYIYGKRRLREIEKRIRFLNRRLRTAEVINPVMQKGEKVLFGASVTVVDEDNKEVIFRIVGVDEVDPSSNKISWCSPIGKNLLQKEVGDVIALEVPGGMRELEIIDIKFIEIE